MLYRYISLVNTALPELAKAKQFKSNIIKTQYQPYLRQQCLNLPHRRNTQYCTVWQPFFRSVNQTPRNTRIFQQELSRAITGRFKSSGKSRHNCCRGRDWPQSCCFVMLMWPSRPQSRLEWKTRRREECLCKHFRKIWLIQQPQVNHWAFAMRRNPSA